MPPVGRHEDSLSRVLHALNDFFEQTIALRSIMFFDSREHKVEVLDGLIIFVALHEIFTSHYSLGNSFRRWYHDPSLVPGYRCVPGRSP